MWSAGRIGHLAKHHRQSVTLDGKTYDVCVTTLPSTSRITNPARPEQKCLWPVFFRGKLAREPPTLESLKEHMHSSPMGHVSMADRVSWFATDPLTALAYGYPDVYVVPAGRTLRLLNVGDTATVAFVQAFYAKHHRLFEQATGVLSPTAATTAFNLNGNGVERGTEWTADTHVTSLLAQRHDLLADLGVDGWSLDWTPLMHTEVMVLNAFPKLEFLGSMFGQWTERDVAVIRQRLVDMEQTNEKRRRRQTAQQDERDQEAQRRAQTRDAARWHLVMDSDDDTTDDTASAASARAPKKPGRKLAFDDDDG